MKIVPKDMKEALKLVWDILNQGDSRYNDSESEIILSDFLIKEAVSLEEKEIPKIEYSEEATTKDYLYNVQWAEKRFAKELLKKEGFQDKDICFERQFLGLRPDIIAESKAKSVIVECCSCKVSKIIDFLEKIDEIWIITKGQDPNEEFQYLNDKMQWFVFRKGENWQEVSSALQKKRYEDLKKIKNPLDSLMGL